jgi:hypothetical protein
VTPHYPGKLFRIALYRVEHARDLTFVHVKKRVASHHSSRDQDFFQCLLLSGGAVPVDPAAFMEAVTHHALAKQKKDDCQDDYKQELSNSERGWFSSGRGRCIHLLSSLRLL